MHKKSPFPPARILIVEDEAVLAMDMEIQLFSLGYDVAGIATNAREALCLVSATNPDLILLDIHLPGTRDGFTVASEVRSGKKIPIVFITAFSSHEVRQRAKALSPYGFLTKPYRPDDLRYAVSSALEQSNAE